MNDKVFALVDCNSFYCSCERLFRPDLLNTPVGVLSNNDGCFVSRTNELKKLGIPMGAPYFKYKDICKEFDVAVFSANFSLYTNLSDRVMSTLSNFSPEMEVYSVDEAFLSLEGFDPLELVDYCKEIKNTVERNTGIPVSIGIGPTKTLSKVANSIAKKNPSKNGIMSLMNKSDCDRYLSYVPVGDVWGVGKQKAIGLQSIGIKTTKQLRDFQNDKLIQKLFTKTTRITVDELRGISCIKLNLETEKKKEIISSRTFGSPVYDLQALRESVASYASLASEKLRSQDSVCSHVEVWVRTNPFKEVKQYYAIDSFVFQTHTSDTRKIIRAAWDILDKIYVPGFEYKKALVKLSGIRDKDQSQLSLFEVPDSIESEHIMRVMDLINQRDGSHTLKSAACGVNNKAWSMKQALKSKKYVTGWTELYKLQ